MRGLFAVWFGVCARWVEARAFVRLRRASYFSLAWSIQRGQEKSNQKRRPPRLALAGYRATAPALPQLGHPCPRRAHQVRESGPGFSTAHPCAGEKESTSCRLPLRGLSTPPHRRTGTPGRATRHPGAHFSGRPDQKHRARSFRFCFLSPGSGRRGSWRGGAFTPVPPQPLLPRFLRWITAGAPRRVTAALAALMGRRIGLAHLARQYRQLHRLAACPMRHPVKDCQRHLPPRQHGEIGCRIRLHQGEQPVDSWIPSARGRSHRGG